MLNLDSIKIEVREVDISGFVRGLTIYESMFGMVQGQIAVQDSTNFFDTMIGSELATVDISFSYFKNEFKCSFYMDGISNMKMDLEKKNYTIHLKSIHSTNFTTAVNGVYNGRSDEIIGLIFENISSPNATIKMDSVAATSGKYIAPNIPASKCFKTITSNSYCKDQTSMFLYQRFCDDNNLRLTSLYDMINNNIFSNVNGTPIVVKQSLMASDSLNPLDVIGTASNFELKEYNMDLLDKLEKGVYGNAINEINLDETKKTSNITKEVTSVPITRFKTSNKLYDNDVKSILANRGDVSSGTIINKTIRVFNTVMEINSMAALPGLGSGMTIECQLGGNKEQGTARHNGKWLVKNMQHNFTQTAGEYSYAQDLGLVRE
jgi:hypothetical protein